MTQRASGSTGRASTGADIDILSCRTARANLDTAAAIFRTGDTLTVARYIYTRITGACLRCNTGLYIIDAKAIALNCFTNAVDFSISVVAFATFERAIPMRMGCGTSYARRRIVGSGIVIRANAFATLV